MEVNKITKKTQVSLYDIVRYQLINELMFYKNEHIIPSDLELLIYLALYGKVELGKFCNFVTKKIYKDIKIEEFSIRSQNIRNRIIKLEKRSIIMKTTTGKRIIQLNPDIVIYKKGNILLNYNFISIETTKA